jgi:RecJ-like exonuclease
MDEYYYQENEGISQDSHRQDYQAMSDYYCEECGGRFNWDVCDTCDGMGSIDGMYSCPTCGGRKGWYVCSGCGRVLR